MLAALWLNNRTPDNNTVLCKYIVKIHKPFTNYTSSSISQSVKVVIELKHFFLDAFLILKEIFRHRFLLSPFPLLLSAVAVILTSAVPICSSFLPPLPGLTGF